MPIYAFVTTQKVLLFIVQCSCSLPHSSVDCSVLLFMLMFRVLFLCSLFHVLFQSSVPCSLLMLHVPFLCSLFSARVLFPSHLFLAHAPVPCPTQLVFVQCCWSLSHSSVPCSSCPAPLFLVQCCCSLTHSSGPYSWSFSLSNSSVPCLVFLFLVLLTLFLILFFHE